MEITTLRRYVDGLLQLFTSSDCSKQLEYYTWFIENAEEFEPTIGQTPEIEFIDAEIKECFHNSIIALVFHPTWRYYEGFVFTIIPIEHAWIVDENGKVIDLTLEKLKWCYEENNKSYDHPPTEYLGINIPNDFLMEKIKEEITRPRLLDYWLKMRGEDKRE